VGQHTVGLSLAWESSFATAQAGYPWGTALLPNIIQERNITSMNDESAIPGAIPIIIGARPQFLHESKNA
jgi:hypothetical protein